MILRKKGQNRFSSSVFKCIVKEDPCVLLCSGVVSRSQLEGKDESELSSTRRKSSLNSTPEYVSRLCFYFSMICVLCHIFSPFIPAIFAFHVLILLMPEQFETLIFRQFPDLIPKAL
jgi:hypothetical protein